MKKILLVTGVFLLLLLCGCAVAEPAPLTEPSQSVTTVPATVPPTTEAQTLPEQKEYTIADLDLRGMEKSMGVNTNSYTFDYNPEDNYKIWGEDVPEKVKNLTPGYVYRLDFQSREIHLIYDSPVLSMRAGINTNFFLSPENSLFAMDNTGEIIVPLYQGTEPILPQSLGYWKKQIYFVEGDRVCTLSLVTGEVTVIFTYPGVLEGDPVYGIAEEFPHLLILRTPQGDVACNRLTGETALIPETGQWGTAAFELYMGFATWPADSPKSGDTERLQTLLNSDGGYWYWRILGCTFADPREISLSHLFCSGLPESQRQSSSTYTEEEVEFLKEMAKNSPYAQEDAWTKALKIPREYVAFLLDKCFGLTMEDVTAPKDWRYFTETDAYYFLPEDSYGVSGHNVTEVKETGEGIIQVYWTAPALYNTLTGEMMENPNMVLTLQWQQDGSFSVLSNYPAA